MSEFVREQALTLGTAGIIFAFGEIDIAAMGECLRPEITIHAVSLFACMHFHRREIFSHGRAHICLRVCVERLAVLLRLGELRLECVRIFF